MQLENKNWLVVFLVLLFLCFLMAAELYPQSYHILEPELTRLEQISQTYKTDRPKLLLQVQTLKTVVTRLQADSTTLNKQLLAERTQTQTLRQSFEQSEKDRLSEKTALYGVIEKWETDYNKKNVEYLKARNQRDMFGLILLVIGIIALGLLVWKLKRFIPAKILKLFL